MKSCAAGLLLAIVFAGCRKDIARTDVPPQPLGGAQGAPDHPAWVDQLPIFDAHLHYNLEPPPRYYSVPQVLALLRRNNVTGILANSRPNQGTQELVAAASKDLWVVPFIRPYNVQADQETWFNEPDRLNLIKSEFQRGGYRGIGEIHLLKPEDARTPTVKAVVQFAVEHDLVLHIHGDQEDIKIVFSIDPHLRVIWAHAGFATPTAQLKEMLDAYPTLWAELAERQGITDDDLRLTPEWRELLVAYPRRFLIGSDTWINERWAQYDDIIGEYRSWLGQLPEPIAQQISHENAEALFGPRPSN